MRNEYETWIREHADTAAEAEHIIDLIDDYMWDACREAEAQGRETQAFINQTETKE